MKEKIGMKWGTRDEDEDLGLHNAQDSAAGLEKRQKLNLIEDREASECFPIQTLQYFRYDLELWNFDSVLLISE